MNVQLLSGKTTRLIVISTEKFSTDGFTITKNSSCSHCKGVCFFKDYTKKQLTKYAYLNNTAIHHRVDEATIIKNIHEDEINM